MQGLRGIFISGLCSISQLLLGQDPWQDKVIQTIGDSTRLADRFANVIVTGHVRVKGSGIPLTSATISADQFKYFNYSDVNGRFILEMPPGNYRISVRHVGFITGYYKIKVLSGGVFNIELDEGVIDLDELVVMARPIDSNIKQSLTGLTTLGVSEIKTLPMLLGEVDIVKSLQLMPGVTTVGEAASGFNVRGGRPDQNLILLNDAPLFNTSHALGFVSSFNQDIVRDFSLYKGTVPSQLGGRASSVLEINTLHGDFEKWSYQGGVGPISARFTAEGPIKKSKSSILLSGRLAYPNWILKQVSDPNVRNSKASFNDFYLTLHHRFSENSTAEFNLYQSHDDFEFSDRFGYAWNSLLAQSRWTGYADRKASPTVSLSYGQFQTKLIDPVGQTASQLINTMRYLQLKPAVNYIPNEQHILTMGLESILYIPQDEVLTGYGAASAVISERINKDNGWEGALFVNDEFEVSERIGISAGLRLSGYLHLGPDSVFIYAPNQPKNESTITDTVLYNSMSKISSFGGLEPRLAIRINTFNSQSVKISYNRMRQYIHQISNTASATPVDLWQVSTSYLPPQIADNYSAGYFWNLKNNTWETSIEFFYKRTQNLVEYKDFPALYVNPHLETELLSGDGRAYGTEFLIRKIKGRWTGWFSYTYSQTEVQVAATATSESINDGNWFASNFNKPHIANLVLNRKTLRNGAFSVTASYSSGRPLTALESSYIVNGTVVPLYSLRNQYKIPSYFRLDVSFTIGNVVRTLDDSLTFSIYNLFGRENAYSVFYQRPAALYLIPKPYQLSILGSALPSLTYNFKF